MGKRQKKTQKRGGGKKDSWVKGRLAIPWLINKPMKITQGPEGKPETSGIFPAAWEWRLRKGAGGVRIISSGIPEVFWSEEGTRGLSHDGKNAAGLTNKEKKLCCSAEKKGISMRKRGEKNRRKRARET